ncbi:hypothetical protein [Burkholderia diffusa]|uniref:hypothetical protein n=1 Tax=Burkholderia diffusa TaxID=488732 RepID=UPI00075A4390|nr:hypothetical protein [Burkholderia diffusa]KVH45256.1 hypothetical protein WJ39_21345 [Burkholderia diffusa]
MSWKFAAQVLGASPYSTLWIALIALSVVFPRAIFEKTHARNQAEAVGWMLCMFSQRALDG